MARALVLARQGQGRVEPNPMVGAVVVRDGVRIGEGFHAGFGLPHAEVMALRNCTATPEGATLYVTLEPCCHHGKTPPCSDLVISSGIKRVVVAMVDPNPLVAGQGIAQLRKVGIQVEVGLSGTQAQALMAPFISRMTRQRPWVIAKWAQSADGYMGHARQRIAISGPTALQALQRLRSRLDALVVGVGTIMVDDPQLTCRLPDHTEPARYLTRVVLDPTLRITPDRQILRTPSPHKVWLMHGPLTPHQSDTILNLQNHGPVTCYEIPLRLPHRLDWLALLGRFQDAAFTNVLIEGGREVLLDVMQAGGVDEIQCVIGLRPLAPVKATDLSGLVVAPPVPSGWELASQIRLGGDVWQRWLPGPAVGVEKMS
jgi:diaminohydroxyphosphoribosylaminopyrimidine deaminase/5-amino-6-(5-phosphoribosylamino)uracil reductase